jgi:hypothetical protein
MTYRLVCLVLLLGVVSMPAGPVVAEPDTTETTMAYEAHRYLNDEREARGLPPFPWDQTLADGAQWWAEEVAASGDYVHSTGWDRHADGYGYVGEVMAWQPEGAHPQYYRSMTTHQALMDSDLHRQAMLRTEYVAVGIGQACRNGRLVTVHWFGSHDERLDEWESSNPAPDPHVHDDATGGTGCDGHAGPDAGVGDGGPSDDPDGDLGNGLEVTRRAGANRFATAAANADVVAGTYVIASGENWPDAVSAAPVTLDAGALLLVERLRVPSETRDVLLNTRPERLVLMGGTAAISPSVESELASYAPGAQVVRVAGPERTTTAALAPRTGAIVVVDGGEVFSGMLAGSSRRGPVLLVGPNGLPNEAINHLREADVGRAYVYGSARANEALANQLITEGVLQTNVPGDSEADPDGTSHRHSVDVYGSADRAVIASGASWPDSLTGAAYAAREGLPLLYAMPDGSTDWSVVDELGTTEVLVIGGTDAIPDSALPE